MSNDREHETSERELLWGMYTDMRTHSRHAESLRSSAVNFVLVTASVLIALVFADSALDRSDLPACLTLAAIGGFGTAFAVSYTELYHRNRLRAEAFRARIDERHAIRTVLQSADERHERSRWHRWGRRIFGSTHLFWLTLPALVMVVGLALAVTAH